MRSRKILSFSRQKTQRNQNFIQKGLYIAFKMRYTLQRVGTDSGPYVVRHANQFTTSAERYCAGVQQRRVSARVYGEPDCAGLRLGGGVYLRE